MVARCRMLGWAADGGDRGIENALVEPMFHELCESNLATSAESAIKMCDDGA